MSGFFLSRHVVNMNYQHHCHEALFGLTMKASQRTRRAVDGLSITAVFALAILLLSGCKNEITPSLYDPNYKGSPTPVISSINPTSGLAGVTVFTITGSNFSAVKEENIVLFESITAQILTASTTQLTVKAPDLSKDSVRVKVTVLGAQQFSNTVLCKLEPAVAEFANIAAIGEPWGIACDKDGNVYVSLMSGGIGVGVKKFTPTGVLSDYSPVLTGVPRWVTLKIGPGGYLYASRQLAALYRIPPGGGPATLWLTPASGVGQIYDFDFDAQGNLWGGGNGVAIYRVKLDPDKSVKAFPFSGNVRSVRVYAGYVYVAANVAGADKIWRFRIISSDSLGGAETYFDFSAQYGVSGAGAYAITFSSDGDLYVGTDGPDGVIVVHADKSWEPLYPGLLKPQALLFAWGKGSELYITRSGTVASHTVIRVNTQKTSAPYYGRQ